MLIDGCAMKAVDDDHRVKDGNPWTNKESVFKYGISAELEVESNSMLN